MTKKDYVVIASAINEVLREIDASEESTKGIRWLVENLEDRFIEDNPKFSCIKFRTACSNETSLDTRAFKEFKFDMF